MQTCERDNEHFSSMKVLSWEPKVFIRYTSGLKWLNQVHDFDLEL
jgi:hypothetical protein